MDKRRSLIIEVETDSIEIRYFVSNGINKKREYEFYKIRVETFLYLFCWLLNSAFF